MTFAAGFLAGAVTAAFVLAPATAALAVVLHERNLRRA